jgi:gluconolactonase
VYAATGAGEQTVCSPARFIWLCHLLLASGFHVIITTCRLFCTCLHFLYRNHPCEGDIMDSQTSLYTSRLFTPVDSFTGGVEGPACDRHGTLYAVNYARQHTIGRVTPTGECDVFLELPNGSIGNGIRFGTHGDMYIADYTNHNVLRVDMSACTQAQSLAERNAAIHVHAHEPSMNQPNDLAIAANDILFASDPNWAESWGQVWRITPDGQVSLLETQMGTTNGIEVSPDERTLYVNETVQRNVWAYDLSPTGEISNKRLLIQFPDHAMDGMRCDVGGSLYITRWGKGTVAKVSPKGELLLEVEVGGAKCTNIAFGGPDGCTCYVTVADRGNIDTFRVEQPGRSWQLLQR